MKDVKSSYQMLSYQINPLVVKGLKNLNISMNEFLLLLYFMNFSCVLDLEDIKDKVSLTNDEVLEAYSSLLSKALIEVKMEKINGKIEERILLDSLYNKLILDEPKKEVKTDIYAKFESEFARSLSPIEYETITNWINNGVKEEVIESALKEAVLNGVTSLRYIDKIIYEWTKKASSPKYDDDYEELYDYDWLGIENEKEG